MKKAIIFDLDGTILNTLQDLANATNYALIKHSMPELSLGSVRNFVGNGVKNLIIRSVPQGLDNPEFDAVFSDFKSYYSEHTVDATKPYEGIIPLLQKLKADGYLTGIVSNKFEGGVIKLKDIFFTGLFDICAGEKEGVGKKPDPTSTLNSLEYLGVSKENAIFIGDSDVDYITAKNAGIPCILVTWGYRDKSFLLENTPCRDFADNTDELYSIIKNKFNRTEIQ